MLASLLALAALVAAGPVADTSKRYSGLSQTDLDALAKVLRTRVATIHVSVEPQPGLLKDPVRIVFGVVVDHHTVATVAQFLTDARDLELHGPTGRMPAVVQRLDLERRVAIIRTERAVAEVGLVASPPLAEDARKAEAEVFALVSTDFGAGVVQGVIAQVGAEPEYEGHPRTTIDLTYGMPVFDAYTRWVGFARTVAWDRDRRMLVPPDKVQLALTSSAATAPAAQTPTRPWWAR